MPASLEQPADAVERLGGVRALARLERETLEAIAREGEWLRFHAGDVLFAQHDPSDAAYFLTRGRVRIVQTDEDGRERVIGERSSGETIGEVGVVADLPRTATVRALRDTEAVRVAREAFDRLVRDEPRAVVALMRVIAERLAEATQGTGADPSRVAVVALVGAPHPDVREAVDRLASALERGRDVDRVHIGRVHAGDDGADPSSLAATIDANEQRGTLTLLDVAPSDDASTVRTLRQADRVVLLDRGDGAPDGAVAAVIAALTALDPAPRTDLVLVQPSHRSHPRGTAARVRHVDEHHHVRLGAAGDVARVARAVMGETVGLVLGGGGARGMAHIGAYRALAEAGVTIDRIGGSSIGGVVAAEIAMGLSPDELLEVNAREFPSARIGKRLTVPLLSVLSPVTAMRMFDRIFGDADMEDLWLPCFMTAVDLTGCRLEIPRRGPVAKWALATSSPPGIWPPVVGAAGTLYVDGAIVDNLPVLPMRELGARHVITVSVSRRVPFLAGEGISAAPTPFAYARMLAERPAISPFPNLLHVLNRTALVTGLDRHAAAKAASDLFVAPPLDEFGLTEYESIQRIVPVGYDAMRAALDERGDLSWLSGGRDAT